MRALTVRPGTAGSLSVTDVDDPSPGDGELLVAGLAVGVCGTDQEIVRAEYGSAPPGADLLVLGHESLGRVLQAPPGAGFQPGDLVAGVVRRPDPEPCGACSRGHFDMCRNGRYTERGIKDLHGYGSELWTVPTGFAVKLDPRLGRTGVLTEPTSVVAKAWEQLELVGRRDWFAPRRVLVTGAGPIGLLAALLGQQRGLDVHVLDRNTDGPKPALVRDLGATYHTTAVADVARRLQPDLVIEATGAGSVIFDAIANTAPYSITCLTGVSPAGRRIPIDAGLVNREIVLENDVVIGSVNANLDHYRQAGQALARADPDWLRQLITRQVPLGQAEQAFSEGDDVKVVITLDHDR